MAPVRAAVDHMLTSHAPFPALAMDRLWTVRQMNAPAGWLFGSVGVKVGESLLDLMLSDRLAPLIKNWPSVAHHAVRRLRTESAAQGGVAEPDRAVSRLSDVPAPKPDETGPVRPMILNSGSARLALFATLAQFGTPEDLTLDDLKIEFYLPAETKTRDVFQALAM